MNAAECPGDDKTNSSQVEEPTQDQQQAGPCALLGRGLAFPTCGTSDRMQRGKTSSIYSPFVRGYFDGCEYRNGLGESDSGCGCGDWN